jgi:DNA-binding response OmpR family regulator
MNNKKKKILVIEDDRALQTALIEALVQEGYETTSAFDGEEGLKKVEEEKPDLILLDLILPKKDGYELLAEIKNSPNKDIPVFILTNLEEIDSVQRALDLGAKTFMVKSDFSLRDVVEKIKQNFSNTDSK